MSGVTGPGCAQPRRFPMISFDEFKKLEFRVGKIVSVADHPNADKLYVMKVDVGGEIRQSVAGLKAYYKPEELEGMVCVVITNLEPAKLRGVESQAMLLAAQEGDIVSCLQPDPRKPVSPGSKVL
jgi:methionyl-tRNA synthetase